MSSQPDEIENIIEAQISLNKPLLIFLDDLSKEQLIRQIRKKIIDGWDPEKSSLESRAAFVARQEGFLAYNREVAKRHNLPLVSITLARKALDVEESLGESLTDKQLDKIRRDNQNKARCSIETLKHSMAVIKELEHGK